MPVVLCRIFALIPGVSIAQLALAQAAEVKIKSQVNELKLLKLRTHLNKVRLP